MIGIVCPVHNGIRYTKSCLQSLASACSQVRDDRRPLIIVVDDGSTDGTSCWIRSNYPEVTVLHGSGHLWWSGAVRLGARYACRIGCEYVLLINNDNLFEKTFLDRLMRFARETGYRVVGSIVIDMNTGTSAAGGTYEESTATLTPSAPGDGVAMCVDWLSGRGTLIHRSVFDQIGFWHAKRFPQYYSDVDFCLRAKKAGFVPVVNLRSVVWNDSSHSCEAHNGNVLHFLRSFVSLRSYFNLLVWIQFLRQHCPSQWRRAVNFFFFFGTYVGGFLKHRILRAVEAK